MTSNNFARRARAVILASVLALSPAMWTAPTAIVGLTAGAATVAVASDAEAKSRSSSGGYARPSASSSSSSSVRTPSLGSSGGYTKPSGSGAAVSGGASSAGDRAMTRQGSGAALDSYRTRSQGERTPSAASTATGAGSSGWGRGYVPPPYYGGYHWSAPSYVYSAPRGFGMWDAMFLWFMLDTLSTPSHAAFFHNNQSDPGYQQWRAEADRLAADNADLRAKLNALDADLARREGQPATRGFVPDDVPKAVAVVDTPSSGGSGWIVLIVVVIAGVVLWRLWRARKRLETTSTPVGEESKGMSIFGTAGNFIDRKFSGKPFKPSLFRVGMSVPIDPTPFILTGAKLKTKPVGDGGPVVVTEIGTITSGPTTVHRLYLSETAFVQIHLDRNGLPDECRYFSVIDEVDPADEDEWGFWLDDDEGMIGWSEFQTKDGAVHPRAWSPGLTRIKPFELKETVETVGEARRARVEHAMLYASPTGAAAPAVETEYVLVAAVEDGEKAWVRIAAGIDINPASLGLA